MIDILDRLKALEGKIDGLSSQSTVTTPAVRSISGPSLVQTPEVMEATGTGTGVHTGISTLPPLGSGTSNLPEDSSPYEYCPSVHEMLAWPAVRELLGTILPTSLGFTDPTVEPINAPILLRSDQSTALPTTVLSAIPDPPLLNAQLLGSTSVIPHVGNALTWDTMQSLSTAFFETFNLLHPIVDRQQFMSSTLPGIMSKGLDDGIETTLAYLIFALGQVAIAETSSSLPANPHRDHSRSSNPYPPGLTFFNEARRRMGFHLATCALSTVQVLALAGIYYGTTYHHAELWRMVASASVACQALITTCSRDYLTQAHRDILRRVFWHCSIMETFLYLELGLPATGLNKFETRVPVPDFGGGLSQEDHVANQTSHFQEHFASQIVLRRLATEFHSVLSASSSKATMPETIKSLAMQLNHWRESLLPTHLHWQEDEPESLPGLAGRAIYGIGISESNTMDAERAATIAAGSRPAASMFTPVLTSPPASYPHAMDIQVALLRTRYYVTKHLIHRPYLYQALHSPSTLTQEDAQGVAACLRSCLKWPITMSPVCGRKRLIPCVFFWTQNLLGVLVVLWMSEEVPILMRVRESLCGEHFESEARETVTLALEWIRDLKEVDVAARWAWGIVREVYGLDD